MKRLKVLIGAYACRPDKGSEPGVGWNLARELAQDHEVWVLTRVNNGPPLEAELAQNPLPNLQVVYCDLPRWLSRWPHEKWEVHLHYALWQLAAYEVAKELHQTVQFDLTHHVTYGRYCSPSFLAFLPIPFVWGPVGGGESAPWAFWPDFGLRGWIYESLREWSRGWGEWDPLVRMTAKNARVAIASTPETVARLKAIGVRQIASIPGQTGINQSELLQLQALPQPPYDRPARFLSLGRLLHWKGFHLGLQAFAQANLPDCEYWIAGEGPERFRLAQLAEQLGIASQVKFLGNLPREQALKVLGECNVLVHPSLHDFSPTVCLEAMAAGRPVLCLDIGGPAGQITLETGIAVSAVHPSQTIQELAQAMQTLAQDPSRCFEMGTAGQQRVREFYSWESKREFLMNLYLKILES